ncbi:MAG: TIGR01459 family HAD-type hydrolase [Alphaproteobacteria bacterium]
MVSHVPRSTGLVDGIGALADTFDTVLLDQWGVVHDGENLHDGAADAIGRLKAVGKQIVILSNSGKRVDDSHDRMRRMGITPESFDGVITSGELVYRNLYHNNDPFYAELGKKFLMLAWDKNRGIVEGTGYTEVDTVDAADFILCAGTDRQDLDAYREVLDDGLARHLPMVCANPDLVSVQPDGTLKICPGTIAETYRALGGVVKIHGKPSAEIYAAAESALAEKGLAIGRAIGVGDSLVHDIKGASDAGHTSLLICGGIHKDEIGDPVTQDALAEISKTYGVTPDYAAPLFVW